MRSFSEVPVDIRHQPPRTRISSPGGVDERARSGRAVDRSHAHSARVARIALGATVHLTHSAGPGDTTPADAVRRGEPPDAGDVGPEGKLSAEAGGAPVARERGRNPTKVG